MWLVAVEVQTSNIFSFSSASRFFYSAPFRHLSQQIILDFTSHSLIAAKTVLPCPHNLCCSGPPHFWWHIATTLIAEQIISVRAPFLSVSQALEKADQFFGKNPQRSDN